METGQIAEDAIEQHRPRETPLQRIWREMRGFAAGITRLAALSLIFTPIILVSFLTIDLPVYALDHFFTTPALKPGNWLTWGQIVVAGGAMVAILIARRFGGDEASRVVIAAWGLAAIAAFAELAYLAPVLSPGDFPSARFLGAFVGTTMLAQLISTGFYDVARGGGAWWRAPFYALLVGYGVQIVIYYPVVYRASGAPWLNWIVVDFAIKAALAAGFLIPYRFFRKRLKPRGGFGG